MARVLMHVHHMMGIGHLRRILAIGRALAALGDEVRCLSGGLPVPGIDPGGVQLVQLAPARARDFTYKVLVDADQRPVTDSWYRRRREAVVAQLQAFRPQLLLTETFPFGRRRLRAELTALLEAAAELHPRPVVVCSIRDVLEGFPGPDGRSEAVLQVVERHYDQVLVHGDPALIDLAQSFPAAARLQAPTVYTGYVTEGAESPRSVADDRTPGAAEVLVSTGGGVVGGALIRAALAARRAAGPLATCHWRILAGHNLPAAEFEALRRDAPQGVTLERNRPDFATLLARAAVSVSQAGYNTVCDVLSARARAVLVPFEAPGQHEQTCRARLLGDRGLAVTLAPACLDGPALGQAVQTAAARPRPGRDAVRLDGAATSAAHLSRWAR